MKTKSCLIKVKATGDSDDSLDEGQFIAYASVFGNTDSYGDVVQPGAFVGNLAQWAESGNPIPLLWGHNMSDPDFNIGHVIEAIEDDHGLKVTCQIDMDSPKGPQVYRLLKAGRVTQMSFAYNIVSGEYVQPIGDEDDYQPGYYSLNELELYEISVVPVGANQETEILAVKTAAAALQAKAGRVLSAKNEGVLRDIKSQLETATASITDVLNAVTGDESKSGTTPDPKDQDATSGEEPPAGKDDQPSAAKATPSPSVRLAAHLQLLALSGAEGIPS
ncbi:MULTISPECIES: HK97 family phage prohead protease [Gordonia]|uniref:HK97 family phage prohead protease n=1 Tax=Gordonia TaxID=2053 RepID=UPI00257A4C39|nr:MULTISPECIES: HK97 family phage prohead protease [Gordonia]